MYVSISPPPPSDASISNIFEKKGHVTLKKKISRTLNNMLLRYHMRVENSYCEGKEFSLGKKFPFDPRHNLRCEN